MQGKTQVQLTMKTENKKTITIPARMVEVKEREAGVTTFVDNGVTYVQDFHTTKETFILARTPGTSKWSSARTRISNWPFGLV